MAFPDVAAEDAATHLVRHSWISSRFIKPPGRSVSSTAVFVCFQPELCTGRWAKPYSQRHSGSPVTCSAAKGVLLLWASDAHSAPATGGKEGSMLTLTCLYLPFLWVLPDRFTQNSGTGNIYWLFKFKDTALINGRMKSWKRGDALPSYEHSAVVLSVIVWMRNPHF